MRLVHVTTVPMSLVFLRGQTAFMRRRGIEVHAVSSPGFDLEEFARTEKATVSAIAMARRMTPLRDLAALVRLWFLLRAQRPSIVHAHTPKGGLLGMIAAALADVPVRIYHLRGLPLLGASGLRRRLLWCTEWIACRLAHRVLCVSRSVQQVVVDERICDAGKLRVLLGGSGNGVDAESRFNPARVPREREAVRTRMEMPADALVIGFVGRLVRDKGIVELAEAWSVLRAKYPQAHLLLVGPEEPQDPVPPSTMAALRQDSRVRLVGMDWNTAPLYSAMDLVVLPTYREGFPNVPLEAAAMCLPVVATRVPGCVDAVADGITGVLVPPRDPQSLAAALDEYLARPGLRENHGRAGRTRVLLEYRPEAIWEALHQQYCELLEKPAPASRLESPREQVA